MPQAQLTSYFVHQLLRARDWQHRPQFDEVCKWWRDGGRGVLALVGMGGAGKTAIAERFLRVLPGGLPDDPDIAKDATLRTPDSVFVFSFYDAPNLEAFFEAIQMWLEDSPRIENALSLQQLYFKLQNTSGLLVLDGLEKVQEDGVRGLLGRLASPKLREFLDRISAGYVPGLSVLVTSRFPLADLRDARPQFFRLLPIDEIELPAGIELLRARGVRGTDPQLASIVEACGRHALTVDFAGGYIAEFGGGDPATPVDFKMDSAELRQKLDDEPHEARRHVLKQGHRFARLAERYRDAMLGNTSTGSEGDAAALALLQRICLFRLGVDAETLADIFTGEKAIKVSGPALAALTRPQLQKKLDWLVRIRIVEANADASSTKTENLKPKTLYTIHPAVRDGFLSSIGDDGLRENHEAIRQGLEVSLGESPGRNPSNPAALDLLEEIIHHTLQSGHVRDAWDIFRLRMGSFDNLARRLGNYERGKRICRAIANLADPEDSSFQAHYELGMFSAAIGELTYAELSYAAYLQHIRKPTRQTATMEVLADTLCLQGKLSTSLSTLASSIRLSEKIESDEGLANAYARSANVHALRGEIALALTEFKQATETQNRKEPGSLRLYRTRGVLYSTFCLRIGNKRITEDVARWNSIRSTQRWGETNRFLPPSNLVLGELAAQRNEIDVARELVHRAHDWAVARDAKDVLCWSALVQARIELSAFKLQPKTCLLASTPGLRADSHAFDSRLINALRDGLKIARDCGFGLYHIDLLLARARLHLLSGEFQAALDDIRTALDEGVLADAQSGQPELPAATHADCGYAWAIAEGLQLRGEALLLQAAQLLDTRFVEPCLQCGKQRDERDRDRAICLDCSNDRNKVGDLDVAIESTGDSPGRIRQWGQIRHWLREIFGPDWADSDLWSRCKDWLKAKHKFVPEEYLQFSLNGFVQLLETRQPTPEQESLRGIEAALSRRVELLHRSRVLVSQATEVLNQALESWQPLHDPEPERPDQNFHLEGKPYNYRAAETYRILTELQGGVLTNYRLHPLSQPNPATPKRESEPTMSFHVFLSHNSKDKPAVRDLKQRLLGYSLAVWFDEDELQPGKPWQQLLEDGITKSGSIAVLVGKDGLGPWEDEEMQGALRLAVADKRPVIPVLLPGAVAQPNLPMFLGNRTWVDLRSGLNKEGLGKLVWGITGVKPGATTVAELPSPKVTNAATLESQTQRTTMTRCKVLFLAANPLDCTSLQLDEEARAIEQRILQTNHRDAIDFVPKFAVRRDDLQLHLNKEQPHILHFSGHGSKDEIAFKGDDGNAASVSKAGLKAMLKAVQDNIRLVVLNACYTRQQADSITDVIDCAIGMKRGIGDEAARVFAASFYLAIGFGRSVQNAFDQAVAALQVMGLPEEKTPILSCRKGIDAANVFLVEATEKSANPK